MTKPSKTKQNEKKDPIRPLDASAREVLAGLLHEQRQAVLATLDEAGRPYTAMVSYALLDADLATIPEAGHAPIRFLLHLSDLSAHKRHLRARSACSLMLFEPDDGRPEILMASRASFVCRSQMVQKPASGGSADPDDASEPEDGLETASEVAPGIDRDTAARYTTAKAAYLAKFPGHQMMFGLGDFDLVLLEVEDGLLNAGFGRAYRIADG